MNILDIVLIIILLLFTYWGYRKGFVKSIFNIAAIVLAFMFTSKLAAMLYGMVADNPTFNSIPPNLMSILVSIVSFIIIYLIVRIIGSVLSKALNMVLLGLPDRILGGFFGIIKGIFIISIIIFIIRLTPLATSLGEVIDTGNDFLRPDLNYESYSITEANKDKISYTANNQWSSEERKQAADNISDALVSGGKKIDEAIEGVEDKATKLAEDAQETVSDIANKADETLKDLSKISDEGLQIEEGKSVIGTLCYNLSKFLDPVGEDIKDFVYDKFDEGKAMFEEMSDELMMELSPELEDLNGNMEQRIKFEFSGENFDQIVNEVSRESGMSLEKLNEQFRNAKTEGIDKNLRDIIKKKVKERILSEQ